MKKSELRQIIKEEINSVLNDGRKPGSKEQLRREVYQLAGKYLRANHPTYKSFDYNEEKDEFYFYKNDWRKSSSKPDKIMSREEVKSSI
jgi:hypothetical protein